MKLKLSLLGLVVLAGCSGSMSESPTRTSQRVEKNITVVGAYTISVPNMS